MLLVGAGLMLRSFSKLMGLDSGLRADQTATLEMTFARGTSRAERVARVDAMLAHVRARPGVTAAGIVNDLPLSRGGGIAISVEVPESAERETFARYLVASEDYFEAAGVPLLSGRPFTRADDGSGPPVAIINDVFAGRYWPGQDAVGRTFRWGGDSVPVTVIGVVAHVRESGLDQDPAPQMYFPARANLSDNLAIVANGTLPPQIMLAHLRASVRAVDPAQAIASLRMMSEVIGKSVETRRANTMLISLFGLLAVVVAVFGVYAVASYAVTQRSREFGIRAALGATRSALLRETATGMAAVCAGGIIAGTGAAWAVSRVMSGLLYGVSAHDPGAFAAAALVLLVAVTAATLVPARRAMRVNPVEVMRAE
jgi:predicted permease